MRDLLFGTMSRLMRHAILASPAAADVQISKSIPAPLRLGLRSAKQYMFCASCTRALLSMLCIYRLANSKQEGVQGCSHSTMHQNGSLPAAPPVYYHCSLSSTRNVLHARHRNRPHGLLIMCDLVCVSER